MANNEFSLRGMKQITQEVTDKRVAEDYAEHLGEILTEYSLIISADALKFAEEAGRKTVRATDIKKARPEKPKKHSFDLPNPPFERAIRLVNAKRVSEGAIEALKESGIDHAIKLSIESNRLANFAERKTIKRDDLELAQG